MTSPFLPRPSSIYTTHNRKERALQKFREFKERIQFLQLSKAFSVYDDGLNGMMMMIMSSQGGVVYCVNNAAYELTWKGVVEMMDEAIQRKTLDLLLLAP